MAELTYIGSDLKFLVEPTATGFDKDQHDWEVTISRGKDSRTWDKSELATDGEGNYYVCFSTNDFGTGQYMITVTTHTPDDDFDDGIRTDVNQYPLINIQKLK